jgi:enediyne biosynthesis protein E4
LQINDGNGVFKDIANYSGIAATDWSWGALMFDMDNDGWNDIYVCNGVNRDVTNLDFMNFFADEVYHKMVLSGKKKEINELLQQIPRTPLPNKVFRNDKNLKFTDIGNSWGLTQPTFSNGAAYGDLDNDGDLDLIVNNENQPSLVYKNNARELNKNNYIGFQLTGKDKNSFAIGSKIQVFASGQVFTRELVPARGFQSSMDYKLIIGLGALAHIDSVLIHWPDRTASFIAQPVINQLHRIRQQQVAIFTPVAAKADSVTYLSKLPSSFDKHQEDPVIDFYTERNIPRMLSKEGPKAAVADVNGDRLDDIFIGGTPANDGGHTGQLYIQTANGQFVKKEEKAFNAFADFEDVAVLFFDCDKDGDKDLLVTPGGNKTAANSRELQLRLFKNDGKGNFTLDAVAFPNAGMNISVAIANDFNKDGFEDLFIGARSYPGVYGIDPVSYLFVNDGTGHFKTMDPGKDAGISKIGMVCSATWANITGDESKELIIAGEWMAPQAFSYVGDHFVKETINLSELYGWWQTISTVDINKDGRLDLVLGNIGENFYLLPDLSHPVKLWINDYDQNGSIEKLMTYTIDGKDMPVFLKRDMEEQLPLIKKSSLKNEVYAKKTFQELFSQEAISKSVVKKFTWASSCIAINNGNGNFTIQKLPPMEQLSCINVVHSMDINNDGNMDLVAGGNQFGFLPQFERLDASRGDILINDGKGNFNWQPASKTGLDLRGEVRDIQEVKTKTKTLLLILQNNEYPVLYEVNAIRK